MTGSIRSMSASLRARSRVSLLVGAVVFLVLAGTGVATASWTASGALTIPASAGSLSFTQSGAAALALPKYNKNTLAASAPITVTNTGTVPGPYKLEVKAPKTDLADAVVPSGWLVPDPRQCPSPPPTEATVGTSLTEGIVLSGSLAPGATAYLCITTVVTTGQAAKNGDAYLTVTLTAQQGIWVSQSSVIVHQSSTGSVQ